MVAKRKIKTRQIGKTRIGCPIVLIRTRFADGRKDWGVSFNGTSIYLTDKKDVQRFVEVARTH